MYKIIKGFFFVALLFPMVLFSEGSVSANGVLDQSAPNYFFSSNETGMDPSTGFNNSFHDRPRYIDSDFQDFIEGVYTGDSEIISGVYVDADFALSIVQQPAGQPGFISLEENVITEFRLARDYGSIGLLAHNYLAGEKFFQLGIGEPIYLVYGDGRVEKYSVLDIDTYQALSPNSPTSQFLNLEGDKEQLSAADLFYRMYAQDDTLIFQTCIKREGNESWGRLFVVAVPGDYSSVTPMDS